MTIDLVYIYPVDGSEKHLTYAWRFLNSYYENPPGADHNSVIVCNGGSPDDTFVFFKAMPNFRLFQHDDSGFDIGGYQAVAKQSSADLMLFCGGTTYFRKPGWLSRVITSTIRYGLDSLYGAMANRGEMIANVYPHIRTTGFWIGRNLFNQYPVSVTRTDQRYEFEHGATGLTTWVRNQNKKVVVVGWTGEYIWPNWGNMPNSFHHGDQSDLLMGDRLSEPPYYEYQ